MSRKKLRVPGRYERPAGHRAALGDHAGEAAIRRQYAIANRKRVQNNQRADELAAAAQPMLPVGEMSYPDGILRA